MPSEITDQRVVLKIVAALAFMSSNNWTLLGQGVVPPPSKEQVGINIDRFIGSPFQSHPKFHMEPSSSARS